MEVRKKVKDFWKWLSEKVSLLDIEITRLKAARDARSPKASNRELLAFEEEIGKAMGSKSAYENCLLYLERNFRDELEKPSDFTDLELGDIATNIINEVEGHATNYEETRRIIERGFNSQGIEEEGDKLHILNLVYGHIPEEWGGLLESFFLKKDNQKIPQ